MFHGSMVALVTPLKNNKIDYAAVERLLEWHISSGTQALIIAGSTGEAATLSAAEKLALWRFVVEKTLNRVPVIAGTGRQGTDDCIETTLAAMNVGVDAVLIMTPAYIKPTQKGLIQHYETIAKAVSIPIIAYNVPGRTMCDMLPKTLGALSRIPNIIGIKEATGDLDRVEQIQAACGKTMDIYSGDDLTALDLMLGGAKGVISVTANVAPQLMRKLCDLALANEVEAAHKVNQSLMGLHKDLFIESNPIPVKYALAKMGYIENELRLPLTQLEQEHQMRVDDALMRANILNPLQSTGTF